MRIHCSGLEADSISDLTKIVRILSDELSDMGQQFEAVSLHVIDEAKDLLTSHYALPESRGYRSSSEGCASAKVTRPIHACTRAD